MLTIGEVRTGLLQNSGAVSASLTTQLLLVLTGERVRSSERPIGHAISPDVLTGVDCRLATVSGAKVRGVGTVTTRAAVTGGRVVQASSHAQLVSGGTDRRQPWSHYLSRPGVVETIGRVDPADLGAGFLAGDSAAGANLGAISDRAMDAVQLRPELDRLPPFRARRTALRWIVQAPSGDDAAVHFTIRSPTLRTVRLSLTDGERIEAVVELCEDLALHDWLLTTLLDLIERAQRTAAGDAGLVAGLRPAIDHLLHLWIPAARVSESLRPLWDSLDRRPGFTRQWDVTVNRIRDQVAVTTVSLLSAVPMGT